VARIVSTVLVVALLAATAAAFALTQGLKRQKSPIFGTDVDKVFSPVCECDTDSATIAFKLRNPDRIDVAIVDGADRVVRTIVRERELPGGPVVVEWNGRDDAGILLPEGSYRPRVHLDRAHRTIRLPNPIRLDVTAPVIERVAAAPRIFSPDGDRRADSVTFSYRLTEPGRAMLFVNGKRRVLQLFAREADSLTWYGKVRGKSLRAGTYQAQLGAFDPAGNRAERTSPIELVIRYVDLGRDRVTVTPGQRFTIPVSSDARRVRWTLGGRSGTAPPGSLRLQAPLRTGQFTLYVSANGHAARVAVVVREPGR
jgi:hypothetical protein